jgi:hypothetical protein
LQNEDKVIMHSEQHKKKGLLAKIFSKKEEEGELLGMDRPKDLSIEAEGGDEEESKEDNDTPQEEKI